LSSSHYSETEKAIIGWTLATKGYISLNWKFKRTGENRSFFLCPVIGIISPDYYFLDRFDKVVKCGNIRHKGLPKYGRQDYIWQVNKQEEVYRILKEVIPYLPNKEKIKLAELVMEFCELRKYGTLKKKPYSDREKEIAVEITAINKKNRRGGK